MLLVDWASPQQLASRAQWDRRPARAAPSGSTLPVISWENRDHMVDAANALTAIIRGTASE